MPIIRTGMVGALQQDWAPDWPAEEPLPQLPPWQGWPVPPVPPTAPRPAPAPVPGSAPRVRVIGFGLLAGLALFALGVTIGRQGGAS